MAEVKHKPFTKVTTLDKCDFLVILTLAKNNMNMREAGRSLFLHPTSVLYNLNRVYEQTGKNPRNFFDLCYLVGIAAQMGGSK